MSKHEWIAQAKKELDDENNRKMIDIYKRRLQRESWIDRIFPWRILIIRKESLK